MKRRGFLNVLGSGMTWPLGAGAQQCGSLVVGFLASYSQWPLQYETNFRQGLGETVIGQNVLIEYRWAEGHYDRLPELAAELVRKRVAVSRRSASCAPAQIF